MESGVCIIDSPGLEDKAIATELALNIAEQAQAIIYVVSEKGLSKPDKEYIYSKFRNSPNNVFFLINKFDLVKKVQRPESLDKIKLELAPVFKNNSDQVNTSLRDKRLFGVSALRALDSRRGMVYDNEEGIDIEKIKQMMKDETWLTGKEVAEYFDIEVLAENNEVAYVRFASVFYEFRTLDDFVKILEQTQNQKAK